MYIESYSVYLDNDTWYTVRQGDNGNAAIFATRIDFHVKLAARWTAKRLPRKYVESGEELSDQISTPKCRSKVRHEASGLVIFHLCLDRKKL